MSSRYVGVGLTVVLVVMMCTCAWADGANDKLQYSVTGGVSGIWVLANLSYAGMRAQNNRRDSGWRILAFIFGFPGTLLTLLAVREGSERAYGVDLPRRSGWTDPTS